MLIQSNQSHSNPYNRYTIAAHNGPEIIEQEEWQLQGSKMNPDSAWVKWSRKNKRCQTSIKMTANLGKKVKRDQGRGTIGESYNLCDYKAIKPRQKGGPKPPLTNWGRPEQLTKTESGIQGTKARAKGIHRSWYWTTHNCHTQRNCFLGSYNPTNLIAIQTIAIQSQHTLGRRL